MEAIRVLRAYSGLVTRGKTVVPDVYALDDARLCGVDAVASMLAKGFAERIIIDALPTRDVPAPAPVVADDEPDPWEDEAPVVAMPVDDEPQSDDEPDEPEQASTPYQDYDSMSVKELKALMEFRGIEEPDYGTGNNGAVLKRDLVAALTEADHYEDGDAA